MHNAAFAALGWNATYLARHVTAAQLPQALADLRRPQVLGANLSLPYKEAALPYLDELTPTARRIGAVNTVIRQGERLLGENTDAAGFAADLARSSPVAGPAVILGAGGAARAALEVLTRLQPASAVYILNRHPEKAEALAEEWGVFSAAAGVPWQAVTLLVNATSAGLNDDTVTPLPEFDFGALPPQALVYDMVYIPAQTRLMREAQASGLRAVGGLGMLTQQARLAFKAWTGVDVPMTVFENAVGGLHG